MKGRQAHSPSSSASSWAYVSALAGLSSADRQEYWAALALRNLKGLGARSIRRLLFYFGGAFAAVQAVDKWREAGVSPERGRGLRQAEWRAKARPEWESSRDLAGQIILWTSPLYPALLRQLPDAPALLYVRGDLELLQRPCVALVGSRACSRKAAARIGEIAAELAASGITVVSGLARGIDAAAHRAALGQPGSTIAVMGAGLDVVYPPEHLELYRQLGQIGLLISEFPPGTPPDGRHFPVRNRIISGLSLGVMVGEAAIRSGSLVTARLALEQNRSVYVLSDPGEVESAEGSFDQAASQDLEQGLGLEQSGCALLRADGAKPCCSGSDILLDLLPQLEAFSSLQKVDFGQETSQAVQGRLLAEAGPGASKFTQAASKAAQTAQAGQALQSSDPAGKAGDKLGNLAAPSSPELALYPKDISASVLPELSLPPQSGSESEEAQETVQALGRSAPSFSRKDTKPAKSRQAKASLKPAKKPGFQAGSWVESRPAAKAVPKPEALGLSDLGLQIYKILAQAGPLAGDELAPDLPPDLSSGTLGAELTLLEVRGLIRRLPGARYEVSLD